MARDLADELLQAKVKARLFGGDHSVRLGRLVILDRLGSGAMGAVYAAYDPRLDRRVAVKVLHVADDAANARSLGEARALGKLAHANVIAVHDAGEEAGAVHIVMELASGTPLRAWIYKERTWRDVVRVLREAATGLAAAHRAGVVHRDIKPDNIVVGDDATRVIDFGLAHGEAEPDDGAGTPLYMAPEVLAGGAATQASDQFSFGVTLFEALYGERPYAGTTREELRLAAANAASARGNARVPSWVHAVVKRALAAEPGQRFPSMDAMVAALSRDRRRARLVVVAVAALAIGGVAGAIAVRGRSHTCESERLATVWNAAREGRVRGALGSVPWTASTVSALGAHATRWDASYRDVCTATRVRGAQSDRLLELRMRCLDRALDRFDVLAGALEGPLDASTRAEAAGAIAQLPSPDACKTLVDPAELALPSDPAQRERVIAAEHALDQGWTAYALGRYREARETVAAIEAQRLDADGLNATLATLAAAVESRVGDPAVGRARLERALAATAKAHAPALEHVVWTRMLRHELFAGNPARVIEWEPFARTAAVRAGLEGAELDGILGEALRDAGHHARAREHLDRALASSDPLRADQRAILEMNVGSVELAMGQPVLAEAAFQRALTLARTQLGDGHPSLALYRDKLADADRARGRIASALAHHEASLALRVAAYGEADRSVATARFHRGETLLEAGQLARAFADLEAARAIRVKLFGPTSPRLGEIDLVLGDLQLAKNNLVGALALYDQAAVLDRRLDVTARRMATGAPAPPDLVTTLPPIAPFSIDRAPLLAGLVAHLDADRALAYAQAIQATWRAARTEDPALTLAAADALRTARLNQNAETTYLAALRGLADEPSRMRLHALRSLMFDPNAKARAAALAARMPELP